MYNAVPLQHLKADRKQTAVKNHLPITQYPALRNLFSTN